MNTEIALKSGRYNELEGIALSVLCRSFPFFVMIAWLLKHHTGVALFSQPGVAFTLAVIAAVLFSPLLRFLEVKLGHEPSFYDASLSAPKKVLGFFKNRKWEAAWNARVLVVLVVYACMYGSF